MSSQIQLLIFGLNQRLCALHLSCVQRVIRAVDATPLPQAPDLVLGAIDLQGVVIPLLNIRRRFGFADREVGVDDQFIIARTDRRVVALAVDEVRDVVQRPESDIIAAKDIVSPLDHIDGVIQLPDGLALIHDLNRFLSLDEQRQLQNALPMEPAGAPEGGFRER